MDKLISRRKKGHQPANPPEVEPVLNALRRSKEARDHLQDLLERSDQKAGFVVTGIAFLGIFVQQGNYDRNLTTLALVCYGLAFILVCLTAFPRKWGWYKAEKPAELVEDHLHESLGSELRESCRQEADLRAICRFKNVSLMFGFIFLIGGMLATQAAVLTHSFVN